MLRAPSLQAEVWNQQFCSAATMSAAPIRLQDILSLLHHFLRFELKPNVCMRKGLASADYSACCSQLKLKCKGPYTDMHV